LRTTYVLMHHVSSELPAGSGRGLGRTVRTSIGEIDFIQGGITRSRTHADKQNVGRVWRLPSSHQEKRVGSLHIGKSVADVLPHVRRVRAP